MNAERLYLHNGETSGYSLCGLCKLPHSSQDAAEECCNPFCSKCGKKSQVWSNLRPRLCGDCGHEEFMEAQRQKEANRFAAAKKIRWTEYQGPLFDPISQNYFESYMALLSHFKGKVHPEAYAWACSTTCFVNVDLDDIMEVVENSETPEDWDGFDLDGTEELTEALKRFNEANRRQIVWNPDYQTAILLEIVG